jgi:hypothetical protein
VRISKGAVESMHKGAREDMVLFGCLLGLTLGAPVGSILGADDGPTLGVDYGCPVRDTLGSPVGQMIRTWLQRWTSGRCTRWGWTEWLALGSADGPGNTVGDAEGMPLGVKDGATKGNSLG